QQANGQDVPPADVEPGQVLQVGEHVLGRLVVRARLEAEDHHSDDDQHAGDMPPDADVVQQRHQPDAELVQHAVQQQHGGVDHDRVPVRRHAEVEPQAEQEVD